MRYISKTTNNGKVVKLKNYKRRAIINKIKRKILFFVLIVGLIWLGLAYAPFMKIKNIDCYSNVKISSKDIISASKICKGNNILRINTKRAIKLIKQTLPYADEVKIRRKFPSTVNINVIEAEIASYVKMKDKYVYIDRFGKVLEISKVPPSTQAPILTGFDIKTAKVNEVIQLKKQERIEAFKTLYVYLNASDFKDILTMINVSDTGKISYTINNTLEIIVGDCENLDYKINFLASGAYENIGNTGKGILDVSYGTKAIYKETQ